MPEVNEAGVLRPPLVMSAKDHARLVALARVITGRSPLVARLLIEEAERAEVMPAGQVPANSVAMGSAVEFRDAATGEERRVQVVLPGQADIAEGRICPVPRGRWAHRAVGGSIHRLADPGWPPPAPYRPARAGPGGSGERRERRRSRRVTAWDGPRAAAGPGHPTARADG